VFPFILKENLSRAILANKEKHGGKFTVLIAGGGEGLPDMVPLVRYFLANAAVAANSGVELKIVVVCGRNKSAYRKLQKLVMRYPAVTSEIYGYVHNMPELLGQADCVVTKAGASLIMETLEKKKPLIISTYIHGQELGNVRFVVKNGAGWFIQKPARIFDKVRALAENSSLRHTIEENIAKLDIKSDLRGIREYILDEQCGIAGCNSRFPRQSVKAP
jgi:processive 1,2-diacylglycerol beta-glucosyltransferase/1,2-diacylglycerol 3-beta-galactosyltransferase